MAEIDILLGDADPGSRPGRCSARGGGRTCGDPYRSTRDGERVQMVFTDPPYNVKIDGHVCGLGGVKHREFAMASGEMSTTEFSAAMSDEPVVAPARPELVRLGLPFASG